jgi:hypothetical protein
MPPPSMCCMLPPLVLSRGRRVPDASSQNVIKITGYIWSEKTSNTNHLSIIYRVASWELCKCWCTQCAVFFFFLNKATLCWASRCIRTGERRALSNTNATSSYYKPLMVLNHHHRFHSLPLDCSKKNYHWIVVKKLVEMNYHHSQDLTIGGGRARQVEVKFCFLLILACSVLWCCTRNLFNYEACISSRFDKLIIVDIRLSADLYY